ncbi:hypothetical protein [Deinococcus sp. UYEF24]
MTLLSFHPEFWPKPSAWTALRFRLVRFDALTREQINLAAEEFGVSAELIASIMTDESVRRDGWDLIQEALVGLGLRLQGRVSDLYWQTLEWACRRQVASFSLGRAQMKTGTLQKLGSWGYLDLPETAQEQWRLLLSDRDAPRLVAACLRATSDYWAEHGVSIGHRADVLATLYSLGFTGPRGIHGNPEASARGLSIAQHADWLAKTSILVSVETPWARYEIEQNL